MSIMKKQMTYEEAIDWLKQYLKRTGRTQVAVANELGVSGALVSSFLAGTYKTPGTVIPKIEELANYDRKKEVTPKAPDYAETTVTRDVINLIEYVKLRGVVGVAYGDAGIGKTYAVREYVRHDSLALYITVAPTDASVKGVNELLCDRMGIRAGKDRQTTREIMDKLLGSGRVIIVDEAQHLTYRTLEHLRSISDHSGIGLALIGNAEVYNKIRGTGRAEFAQLFSRVGMRKNVLTTMLKRDDIQRIFGPYGLESDVIDILAAVARTPYGLRGAVNVYINAAAVFGQVDKESVTKILKDMNIG